MKNLRSERQVNDKDKEMGRWGDGEMGRLPLCISAVSFAPVLFTAISVVTITSPLLAAPEPAPALRVIVNSNQDGPAQADDGLTLREAIELTNGTLPLDKLSPTERAQVEQLGSGSPSRIDFNLPADQTTIRLVNQLPPLEQPGLILDGTTQSGYAADRSAINELPIPVPIVVITPAEGKEVLRGLTITADGVTVRGLSLYGFTSTQGESRNDFLPFQGFTLSTPPADIFISHRLPPPDISKQQPPANFAPFYPDDRPPKDVVIENNWLGTPPTAIGETGTPATPENRSAFGVSVFNGVGTLIRRNWIANHDGSAIITSVRAEGMKVSENVLTGNGVAGMPDAIRLEGDINQTQITGNLVCANDGSGVYLFKPQGAAQIQNNKIIYNGRRLRRAAVYLMGNNHQVTGNEIRYQAGPGVVVASYPKSDQNLIQSNLFSSLEGLSIDLVTQQFATSATDYTDSGPTGAGVYEYQRGDGPNPERDSPNRRKQTGNAAINAPKFVSPEFVALGTGSTAPVQISGIADPGSEIELYRSTRSEEGYGPLAEVLGTAKTDDQGKFNLTVENIKPGEQVSAIATDPQYGTSEPARNALIRSIESTPSADLTPQAPTSIPRCTTAVAQEPPPTPPQTPEPITLQVPRYIHFALDKYFISPATAKVLDRIAQVLLENPSILVDIIGHTDYRASYTYNLALGMRRAIAARNYLLKRGVPPERMTIRSQGKRQLRYPGSTRLDHARNRRVEFDYQDARNIEVIIQEEDLQLEP
ncbi:OmpA family protein [Kovacikia minuta CCNUW1]|uniref:OmpA family protein n=1 Tax=Kovacikia minuta TaxID=2931930 RepID=UPI001CCC5A49|nr:OmpA family protein [Kovacikia minuta]UBF26301.1 OmpA family protein [Kovacikia minuta CCNUW1]